MSLKNQCKRSSQRLLLLILLIVSYLNFIADVLPQVMQESFAQKIDTTECAKIITNFEKDHQDLYKQALEAITQKEVLLTSEEKKNLVIQMLAYGFMYRSGTSKGHKAAKKVSIQKTKKHKRHQSQPLLCQA